MRLNHDAGDEVVLYDDHGEEWSVALVRSGPPGDASDGNRELGGPGVEPQRILRFRSATDGPVDVPYGGGAERMADLTLGDVVEHFLRAME